MVGRTYRNANQIEVEGRAIRVTGAAPGPRLGSTPTTGRISGGPLCFGTVAFGVLLRRINLPVRQA